MYEVPDDREIPHTPACKCVRCVEELLYWQDDNSWAEISKPTPQRRIPSPARKVFFQSTNELIARLTLS